MASVGVVGLATRLIWPADAVAQPALWPAPGRLAAAPRLHAPCKPCSQAALPLHFTLRGLSWPRAVACHVLELCR